MGNRRGLCAAAIFLLVSFHFSEAVLAACQSVCNNWGTCTECVGTCNRCNYSEVADSEFTNKSLNNLPTLFKYSHGDTNTANDSCGSTDCGTLNCGGRESSASNNKLPIQWSGDACSAADNSRVPTQVSCRWKDYSCQTYCSRYQDYSCCTDYTTVCD